MMPTDEKETIWADILFRDPCDILLQVGNGYQDKPETISSFTLGELISFCISDCSTIEGRVVMDEDEARMWQRTADILERHAAMVRSAIAIRISPDTNPDH